MQFRVISKNVESKIWNIDTENLCKDWLYYLLIEQIQSAQDAQKFTW